MAKQHQLLAVEAQKEGVAKNLITESVRTFNKESLFNGSVRYTLMFADSERHLDTKEVQEVTTTVDENLDYTGKVWAEYIDTLQEKDETNCLAKADLIVDGKTLAPGLPATFLLGLENKLNSLKAMYQAIPTLPPGIKWEIDPNHEKKGVYVSPEPTITHTTKKDPEYRVVYEATKEHPAQIEKVERVVKNAKVSVTNWSGKISSARKADILSRLSKVIAAVKDARARANQQEVPPIAPVANKLVGFIHHGEL